MRAAKAAVANVALLEGGFNLDVGDCATERSTKCNSRVPDYDAFSDPHLIKFWRQQRHRLIHFTDRDQKNSPAAEKFLVSTPVGADHILAIKRVFYRFSEEYHGSLCKSPHCVALTAGVLHEHARVVSALRLDALQSMIKFGIALSNHFRLLAHRLPLSAGCGLDLFRQWLSMLSCETLVDWPSFLLLCTVDLVKDFSSVQSLHEAFLGFTTSHPMRTEEDFCDLLSFLLYSRSSRETRPVLFYQPGDCYKARHSCNFAEALFSLMPHRAQFYLCKANARGYTLSTNNCGHVAVVPMLLTRGSERPKSAAVPKPPSTATFPDSRNIKSEAIRSRTKMLRYQNSVFL